MRLVQDCVNDILPTEEEAQEALGFLSQLMPDKTFTLCGGAVGHLITMPNGATCFHCPPILLPNSKVERSTT